MLNLGILISGRGSNMSAILKYIRARNIPINPTIVISNRPDAKGLDVAKKMNIKTAIVESKGFRGDRTEYDNNIIKLLMQNRVTPRNGLVCLAGFMRILSPSFVLKYKNRILNIHPSLLPTFPGINAQKQALDYGVKYTGCTVHIVDEKTDTGPIVIQDIVKIDENDTELTLAAKILRKEHKIYPKAVELFAQKRIKVIGRRVQILPNE